MSAPKKIEFGDFQTPLPLAKEICALLVKKRIKADTIVEPTCGVGAFLLAAAAAFPKARLLGWDINSEYVVQAKAQLLHADAAKRATIASQDFFAHDWEKEFAGIPESILVLGNLPWVTNVAVSALNGSTCPARKTSSRGRRPVLRWIALGDGWV